MRCSFSRERSCVWSRNISWWQQLYKMWFAALRPRRETALDRCHLTVSLIRSALLHTTVLTKLTLKTVAACICVILHVCVSGCHPAKWYSSCYGHTWADEDICGHWETGLGCSKIHTFMIHCDSPFNMHADVFIMRFNCSNVEKTQTKVQ